MATIKGTNGNDVLNGTEFDDKIDGDDGNDVIYGNGGDDDIKGGKGVDSLYGGAGNDTLKAGSGSGPGELLDGGDGNDSIEGGKGGDTIFGGAGDEQSGSGKAGIKAGDGNDVVYAQEGNDIVEGEKGDDLIYGGDGNDSLDGGTGNDTLSGNDGNDTLDGGKGADFLCGGEGDDLLLGGSGSKDTDTLYGGVGNDTMIGGKGDDEFYVGTGGGNNVVFGDKGTGGSIKDDDVLYVEGTVEVSLNGTTYTLNAGDSLDIVGLGLDKDDDNGVVTLADGTTVAFDEIARIEALADIEDPDVCMDPTANKAPVAVDDAVSVDEDDSVLIAPLGNDSDPDGDTISVIGNTDPANGTLVDNGDGTFTYEPDADYNGTDSFTYTISDGNGETSTATVSITVDPVNDDPVAVADSGAGDEDTVITGNVLANDSDVDGDPLEVVGNTDPTNGSVTVNPDGSYSYTPDANFNGTDSFTYTVSDGNGGTDTATVSLTVNPVNDDPVAVNDSASTDEDTPVIVPVLSNDSDVDGDTLSVDSFTQPPNGTVTDNGDGTVTYTPDAGFTGTDTFTYTVSDGNGGTDTGTVTVSVDNVNDDPVAVADTGSGDEDTVITGNVLANDSDPDSDPLEVVGNTDPANGSVTVNPDGSYSYTPDADFNGTDSFTYTVSDGNGGTDTATVSLTVNAVNDDPVAVDDTGTGDEDGLIVGNVLANDSDVDGDTLTVVGNTDPSNGTLVINPDGSYGYTPDANFNGTDSFTYTVSDGNGGTDTATVSLTVNAVNDDPVAVDDTPSTDEDTPVIVPVLANDSDVDGDTLDIDSFTQPPNGTVTDNGDGTVTYTPDAGFNGTDTFTYTVSDGNGGTDTGTVTVSVGAVNDDPTAVADTGSGDEDTVITGNVLANDSDPDSDPLEVIGNTDPTNGSVTVNPDGSYSYTPDANFNGTDTFSYTVSDGNGGTDTATVSLTVNAVNDDPVAVDDTPSTDEDTPVIVPVLANDSDVDGDTLEIDSFTQPPNGTVTDNGDGTVTYTPDAGFNGTDTFTYTVSDGNGGTDTGTVTVDVGGVNDDPTARDDDVPTDEDTPIIFNPTANDSDPDGDPLEVSAIGDPPNGTITDNGDGTFTYTPDPDFNGTDTVTYTVSDGNGGTDTGTITFNVAPVNDDPVAEDDSETTAQGTPVIIPVLANDSDVDGDTLSIDSFTQPPNGTVTDNGDGTLTYTPDPAFDGTDTFSYTVSDGNGGTDTATVDVRVTDVAGPVDGLNSGEDMNPGYTDLQGDMIDGSDGDDDTIFGNGGDDTIDSGEGDDTVDGGGGDDTFEINESGGGIDNDVIIGGETDETDGDTVDTSDIDDDLTVVFTDPEEGTITDGVDTTTFEEIENIVLGGGDDTVTGSDGDENVDGGDGNNEMDGGDGDDTLKAGDGDDTITGGSGSDSIDGGDGDNEIDTSGDDPLVDDKNGDGFGFASYGPFPAAPKDPDENDDRDFVVAGSGNDTITTGDDADTIFGGSGDNVIDGGIDDDVITTTFGDDLIIGGEGSDTISSGAGNDTIYGGLDPALPDALNIPDAPDSGPFGPDPDPENGRDFIEGGAGNDLIYGQDDDDTIFGGGGADTIYGGIDDDFIDGGNIKDDLYGGQGNDTILGGGGSDNIEGGEGADSMEGGDGNDRFIINAREDAFGDTVIGGNGPDETTDRDTLDLRGLGRLEVIETVDATDDGATKGTVNFLAADGVTIEGTLEFSQIERLIICFTPGVAIATPKGEIAVEDLKAGDRVITRDDGVQEIRWIGTKKVSALGMQADPSLRPVMIRKGALGNGLPERDMMVSPNHRMLMANEHTHVLFDEREVLVAAKHLIGQPGIERAEVPHTEYIHVMFDRHEVILGDGAWTESFHPGDYSLKGIDKEQRDEIFKLFPELTEASGLKNYGAARHSLKGYEAKMLREGLVL